MNSFICIFVCVYQALQNSLVYTISVISVFVSYTYVCYVLVYFVLYVYNCMHKKTIKYLVSCILYLACWLIPKMVMHSRCSETSYTTYPDIKATNVYTLQNQSDVGTPHDIGRGPDIETLPPPGDFCRHIFLKTMDLELPKCDCLQEIRWCVWLWRAFEDRYPLKNSKIQL